MICKPLVTDIGYKVLGSTFRVGPTETDKPVSLRECFQLKFDLNLIKGD
jgi:hypothetical protein